MDSPITVTEDRWSWYRGGLYIGPIVLLFVSYILLYVQCTVYCTYPQNVYHTVVPCSSIHVYFCCSWRLFVVCCSVHGVCLLLVVCCLAYGVFCCLLFS